MERVNLCCNNCINQITDDYTIVTNLKELQNVINRNYMTITYTYKERCQHCYNKLENLSELLDYEQNFVQDESCGKLLCFGMWHQQPIFIFNCRIILTYSYATIPVSQFLEEIEVGCIIIISDTGEAYFNEVIESLPCTYRFEDISIGSEFLEYDFKRYIVTSPVLTKCAIKK